jgi:hypothetical protein
MACAAVGRAIPDRRDRIQQRQQLSDVVAMAAGQGDREWDAVGSVVADDQVPASSISPLG